MVGNNPENVIENLKSFRELSSDQCEHHRLLKDKRIILYAATLLDNSNVTILNLCLDILDNFVANEQAHSFLTSTFGIYEAVEALAMRMRYQNEKICTRATEITDILRTSAPPAYNTRSRVRGNNTHGKQHHLYLLFVEDIDKEHLPAFEQILLRIRGIISFLVDLELKRCTLRLCPKISIKEVIEKIYCKCSLKALVVMKNTQTGVEDYCDILQENITNKSYLEYHEDDFCPKEKSVAAFTLNMVKNSNNLLKSVKDFWTESFYW